MTTTMSTTEETQVETQVVEQTIAARGPRIKKLKPARKQVKAGDVEKKEAVQTGKEYSESIKFIHIGHVY